MTNVERETKKIINRIRKAAELTTAREDYCDLSECNICARFEANRRILRRLRLRNI